MTRHPGSRAYPIARALGRITIWASLWCIAATGRGDDIKAVSDLARRVTAEPRKVLESLDIGESELHFFRDGETEQEENRGTLVRLLNRVADFSLNQLHQWQAWEPSWTDLGQHAARFRGAICRLEGDVTQVLVDEVPVDLRERYPFANYYRIEMKSRDATSAWTVYVRRIPNEWMLALQQGKAIHEHIAVAAMFLHVGAVRDGIPSYVLVADRPVWLPRGNPDALPVNKDVVWLASLGVDASQLLPLIDRTRLVAEEREVFYQVLHGVGKVTDEEMSQRANREAKVSQLLAVQANRGQVFTLQGHARRALRIEIENAGIRNRYGMDHYYELEVFVDSDVTVRFADRSSSQQEEKIFDPYPFVFCVRTLPAGMPVGEAIHESVSITGVYFKQWAYRSDYLSGGSRDDKAPLQFSPLLIGRAVKWRPSTTMSDPVGGWIAGGAILLFAIVIVWMLVRFTREDRRFRSLRRRYRTGPPG